MRFAEEFTCIVRALYSLSYYQVVCQFIASGSAEFRAALLGGARGGEPAGLRAAAKLLLAALAGSDLFTEDGPPAQPAQPDGCAPDLPDLPDLPAMEKEVQIRCLHFNATICFRILECTSYMCIIKTFIIEFGGIIYLQLKQKYDLISNTNKRLQLQNLLLPFLRIAALLRHHLYGNELPEVSTPRQEFVRLAYYLELVTDGMEWSEWSAGRALPPDSAVAARAWARQLGTAAARGQLAVSVVCNDLQEPRLIL